VIFSAASAGIVVDVAALDVIDSFVARALRDIAVSARLRGAETIVVGIQPEVAIAMVYFKLDLHPLQTALDLDEALDRLEGLAARG
jgi:rsbT antagonist protein RsbS